jgi:hypothetical protein
MGMFKNMLYNKLNKDEMKMIEDSAVMEFDYFFIKQVISKDKFEVLNCDKQKCLYDVMVNDYANTRNVFSVSNPHVNDEYRRYVQFEGLFKKQKRRNSISGCCSSTNVNTQQQTNPVNDSSSSNTSLDVVIKETI